MSGGQLKGIKRDQLCDVNNSESLYPDDFVLSVLSVRNLYCPETKPKIVYHLQFLSWPDYGVPEQADSLLALRNAVKCLQKSKKLNSSLEIEDEKMGEDVISRTPVVVHCSAGIGRTGTFCTIDICLSSLEHSLQKYSGSEENILSQVKMLTVPEVLLLLRNQRAHSVQNGEQYAFCYEAIFRYMTTRLPFQLTRTILKFVMNNANKKQDDEAFNNESDRKQHSSDQLEHAVIETDNL